MVNVVPIQRQFLPVGDGNVVGVWHAGEVVVSQAYGYLRWGKRRAVGETPATEQGTFLTLL